MKIHVLVLAAGLWLTVLVLSCVPAANAARHRSYIGVITRISATSLTIHSRTHSANYSFVFNAATRFLQRGKDISRLRFRVGATVSVSFSTGARNTLIAYHVNLRG